MEVLAIIPARGGSKSIPRKNLADIGGKPLIAHSIAHAATARSVNRTIVSTEDAEIAEIARAYGAEVPFLRPIELAGDTVLDHPVFEHALKALDATEGYRPDIVVHLRPTAPLRRPGWIDDAVDLLASHPDADSVRSVSAPAAHPYRIFRINDEGYLEPLMKHEHPQPFLLRRQDLPPVFHYNAVLDVTRATTVLDQGSMTGRHMLPLVLDADDVFDIDSPRDLEIARMMYERFR